ncbi:MAG: glycosyltransferase [Pirellulales bacterium]
MRILLANDGPLDDDPSGQYILHLAGHLMAAGHRVRCLVLDSQGASNQQFVQRILCRRGDPEADLPFALPSFRPGPARQSYSQLSDGELAAYREVVRRALDTEIDAFDPEILDIQHVWLQGHLALEAGAPYVLTSHGQELPLYHADARFRRYAVEAAENARRILVLQPHVANRLQAAFGDLEGRIFQVRSPLDAPIVQEIEAVYRNVLTERFGTVHGLD